MGELQLANKRIYHLFVENPISGDNIPRLFIPRDFLVQEIRALKLDSASGSVDWTARYDPDASLTGGGTILHQDTGVTNNTTGVIYTAPFDNITNIVPAGNWLWMELANVSTGLFRPVSFQLQFTGVERGA